MLFQFIARTPTPREEERMARVERCVSPALWSFMNESRRLDNGRVKQELRVVLLRRPQVAKALASIKEA